MEIDKLLHTFNELQSSFKKSDILLYKDLEINGLIIRPIGFHYMNNGCNWAVNSHCHSFFEIHYIIDGSVFTVLNGIEYKIMRGQFYVMPPKTYHSHRQLLDTYHTGFALRFDINSATFASRESKEFLGSMQRIQSIPFTDTGEILEAFYEFMNSFNDNFIFLQSQILFFKVLLKINNFCSNIDRKNITINQAFLDNNVVNDVIAFIDDNYAQEIDVNDVSNSVHLSYSHLSRLFKTYTGRSIIQQINITRVQKAQYLLNSTSLDIDSIATKVGFKSAIYFCGVFKKIIGNSPNQYRKKGKKLSE
jgi:AraC-like DNA-binding protein